MYGSGGVPRKARQRESARQRSVCCRQRQLDDPVEQRGAEGDAVYLTPAAAQAACRSMRKQLLWPPAPLISHNGFAPCGSLLRRDLHARAHLRGELIAVCAYGGPR
ncbi:hypothetical protein MTO96_013117 [Rhipicephalus appendiculatus]